MTIEANSATGVSQTTGAHVAGKASGAHAADDQSALGFAGLVSALSVQDDAEPTTDAAGLPSQALADDEENMPIALIDKELIDINIVANLLFDHLDQSAILPAQTSQSSSALLSKASVTPASGLPVSGATLLPLALPQAAVNIGLVPADAALPAFEIKPDAGVTQSASPGSAHETRLPQLGTSLLQAQQDAAMSPTPKAIVAASTLADLVRQVSDIDKPKSQSSHSLRNDTVGAPNLFDKWGISPTYAVAQASAVVPSTQVAETVSYWVTHGVQRAELTLDGLGSEPVEVHISVDGDQTRVDFRTGQVDVRQALEGAAGQLKSLLASEGLQLLAVSVGTSARDNTAGGERQSKSTAQQRVSVARVEVIGSAAARVVNTSVGQALDLYV